MEQKDNLLGVVETIFKWKKFIIYTCLATAIGASIIVLLLPVYYDSTTIFYAASPDLATPEAIFGEAAEAPDYYGTENDIDRILSIANSGELVSFMIDSFDLYDHYDMDPETKLGQHYIRLEFNDHFDVIKTKYDAIEMTIEDQDRELAAKMVNAARDYVANLAQGLIKDSQAKLLKTFQANITEKTKQLTELNDTLQAVRSRYGVYNTLSQSESLAELVAKAEAKLFNAQAKLEILQGKRNFADSVTIINARIKGYENELTKLNERLNTFNQGMARVEILKETQLEASEKLAENREHFKLIKAAYNEDFPTIMILEDGAIPLIKSRPKRTLIVVAAVAVAFIFSVIGILLFDTYKDVDWRKILDLKPAKA